MQIILPALITFILVFVTSSYLNYKRYKQLSEQPASSIIINLTDKDFKQKTSKGIVLVDFWAPWCKPCNFMAPTLNQVAEKTSGKAMVAKVNVDDYKDLASRYRIRSIPTLILLKDGQEIKRFAGIKSEKYLLKQIKKI